MYLKLHTFKIKSLKWLRMYEKIMEKEEYSYFVDEFHKNKFRFLRVI